MWRVKSDASFRSNLRDNKIDKTKQIANILREIPPPSKMPEFKVDRTMFSNSSAPLLSNREHQPALTYRPSPHASHPPVSVWNDAKHREMMERMSSSLQHCQHLLVSVRKKIVTKAVKLPPLEVHAHAASVPQAIWISAPAISSLFASLSQGDVASRGSISLSEWLKFCKDTDCFSKLKVAKSDCARAFNLATTTDVPGSEDQSMDLEKFCQCLIFLAHLAGIFPGLGVDSLPTASNCDSHTSRCISVLLLKLLANGIEADFDILSLSSGSHPRGLPSAQPSPRTARIAMQGRTSTASTSSVAAQQVPSLASSVDGEVVHLWKAIPGIDSLFASIAASDPGLLGAVGARARTISMIEWLKFCKDYDAYAKLHLSKTDCVRAFQLANSMGNSDADIHEMDMDEFCQCLLFLAKMAGFLGEGDQVPLASQCALAVAENVSKLLILLGCIVPEVGNRSSRNLARMKRQASVKGHGDGLIPSPSRINAEPGAGNMKFPISFSSGDSADGSAAREVAGIALSQSPTADASDRLLVKDSGNSPEAVHAGLNSLHHNGSLSGPAGNTDDSVAQVAAEHPVAQSGNLEQAAIANLQCSFRDMNLLPQQKWIHFASCLAQAGVNSLQDLLHLGSDDEAVVKFLGDTCGMNVIQGRKVIVFLRAT